MSVHSVTKKAAGSLAEAHSTTGENKHEYKGGHRAVGKIGFGEETDKQNLLKECSFLIYVYMCVPA